MKIEYTKANTIDSKYRRALKPDAQAFDKIELVTVPRYKESNLSGNEWRISIMVRMYRKGNLIYENFAGHKMEDAVNYIAWKYAEATDSGKGLYCGEGRFCDQEGCSNEATVVYQLKKEFCDRGHENEPAQPTIRLFCDEHKKRGDCGLEDADENYIQL